MALRRAIAGEKVAEYLGQDMVALPNHMFKKIVIWLCLDMQAPKALALIAETYRADDFQPLPVEDARLVMAAMLAEAEENGGG